MKAIKKIVTSITILAVCAAVTAGCMENQTASSASSSTASSTVSNSTDASSGTSTDSSSGSTIIKQGTIEKKGNVILKELAFVYNGNTIAISDITDDEKLESILGKAVEIKSHTYSKDDGLNMDPLNGFTEKRYKFPGIDIKTINGAEDKKFYIFNINITDPKYSTIRNIKVGDSVEKLMEAYPEGNMLGNGVAGEEDDFQFLPVNYVDGMKFHVKDKKIESILMYKLLD